MSRSPAFSGRALLRPLGAKPRILRSLALTSPVLFAALLAGCGGGGGGNFDTSGLVKITTQNVSGGTTGVLYNALFDAEFPHPPGRYAVVGGALPPGLALDRFSGELSGYPRQVGVFTFTLAARDGVDTTLPPDRDRTYAEDRQNFTMNVVLGPPNILPQTLPPAQYRANYGYQIDLAGGTPPYVFQQTGGTLPAGVAVSTSGFVGSFATQAQQAPYVFQVTVTDAHGLQDTETLELSVTVLPLIIATTSPLPPGAKDFPYSLQMTLASGGGGQPYAWSQVAPTGGEVLLSSLGMEITTAGILRNAAPATGPTQVGTFRFSLQVQDEAGQIASRAYELTVNPGPVLTSITPNKSAIPGPYSAKGSAFQSGAQLVFKPGPTEVVITPSYQSPTLLTFANAPPAPAGAGGFVTVRVKNPDGGYFDLPNAFAFPAVNLSFDTTPHYPNPQSSLSSTGLDVADVNKDGFADVVHCGSLGYWGGVNGTAGGVDLLVNKPTNGSFDGTFTKIQLDTGTEWYQVRFVDVDSDGDVDVVAIGNVSGAMRSRTWLNPYPAAWTTPGPVADSVMPYSSPYTSHASDMAVGLLSAVDGVPDLAYVTQDYPTTTSTNWNSFGGTVASVKGAGNGTFSNQIAVMRTGTALATAAGIALGRMDGDTRDDVAISDQAGNWVTASNNGAYALTSPSTGIFGSFTPIVRNGSNGYSENLGVAIGDVSGDGNKDILTAAGENDSWSPNSGLGVFQGDGNGTFSSVTPQAGSSGGLYRYVTTFDGDFDVPLDAAATLNGGKLDIWKGRTASTGLQFKQTIQLSSDSPNFGRIRGGDFNNDGREDLCLALSFLADRIVYSGDTPNVRGLGGKQGVVIFLNTSQ